MPALQLRYNPSKKYVYRFAYTRTISRPAYGDIAPKMNVSIRDKTVSEGNPALTPTLSNNLDLLGEYYSGGTGLISGGIYFKNITSYTVITKDAVRFSTLDKFVMTPEELIAQGGVTQATITDYKRYYDPLKKNDELLARTKPMNAGTANLLGAEIAFQRNLSFLPGLFSHFSIYANANNLLSQAQRRYMWKPEYTYSSLYTGTTAQIGLKLNVF